MVEAPIALAPGDEAMPGNAVVVPQSWAALTAAMVFGSLVFLAMSTPPILLSALVDARRLSTTSLGQVATLETIGIAVGSLLGPNWLRAGGFRLKALLASALLIALNLICYRANVEATIGGLRAACGLVEGVLLAAAVVILTYVANPERMNGYFLFITAVPQIAASYFLTSFAIPKMGVNVGFGLMAATAVVSCVASLGLSDANAPRVLTAAGRIQIGWRKVIAVLAILLQNGAIGAGFSYIAQIATQHAVSNHIVGVSLAVMQATACAGGLAVGVVGWRLNHTAMLVAGCALQAVITLFLGLSASAGVFFVATALFGLCWNGLLPYSLKLLIDLDPTRRLAVYNSPLSLIGLGIGPIVASAFVVSGDVTQAFTVSTVMFLGGGLLYLLVQARGMGRVSG